MKLKTVSMMLVILVLTTCLAFAQTLPTPAEKTNFREGPTMYDDLMEYVFELEGKSDLLHVQKVTTTLMGRDVVLCVMANPPVHRPSDIINSDKPIVLIVNNVHGGEVAGKEASLMLMRDLLFGDLKPLLDDIVVLNIPTINPDGAELLRRTNEQNYDMNRDYIKLETQEIHALVTRVINPWQPDIHVDTHHGGSDPYTLTYQTIMNPAGDAELMRFGNEEIIPAIFDALRAKNYEGFWYSGARRQGGKVVGWQPTSVEPRKQHVYSGLANMLGFLFETPRGEYRVVDNGTRVVEVPEEERYYHQVQGEYIGLLAILQYTADHPKEVRQVVIDAKKRATELGNNDRDNDQIVMDYEQVSKFEQEFWFREGAGRSGNPDAEWQKKKLPIFTKFTPTETTERPWGYVLPPQLAPVVRLLLDHEITVKRMIEPVNLDVEAFYATDVDNRQYFQGHYLKTLKVIKQDENVEFPKGSFFVPAGQPKSNFICYILEPSTNDNIVTWSFLDMFIQKMDEESFNRRQQMMRDRGWTDRLSPGQHVPIYRLMRKAEIKGVVVEPYDTPNRNQYIK